MTHKRALTQKINYFYSINKAKINEAMKVCKKLTVGKMSVAKYHLVTDGLKQNKALAVEYECIENVLIIFLSQETAYS